MSNEILSSASKFIDYINKKYRISFAYLFGSRARGEENSQSDIDIAVYFEENYTGLDEVLIRGDIIEEGKAYFKLPVDLVSLRNSTLLLKYAVVKDGIVLKDSDERGEFELIVLRDN